MQLHAIVFFAVQAGVSGYALVKGGAPERLVAIGLSLAAVATSAVPVHFGTSFRSVEWVRLAIDLALLAYLVAVALGANRYWPMWVAAVQLDTVAIHGVRAYDQSIWALVYASLLGWAAYPILALLAIGTFRHRAREARTGVPEPGWTWQRRRVASAASGEGRGAPPRSDGR